MTIDYEAAALIAIDCPTKTGFKPVVRRADTITERELVPLWPGVLWRGYPTILAGEPGLSKSTVSVDIAARLSRGDTWPGSQSKTKRGNVLFLTAEDAAEDVVKPRLRVASADTKHVYFFDGLRSDEGKESDINLTEHLPQLDATIAALKIDLVIVDPISAYEGNTDSHKNSEVRAMLKGVQRVARRHKCSFLLISHYNKSTNQSYATKATASLA
jgi:RecA-family ATPase